MLVGPALGGGAARRPLARLRPAATATATGRSARPDRIQEPCLRSHVLGVSGGAVPPGTEQLLAAAERRRGRPRRAGALAPPAARTSCSARTSTRRSPSSPRRAARACSRRATRASSASSARCRRVGPTSSTCTPRRPRSRSRSRGSGCPVGRRARRLRPRPRPATRRSTPRCATRRSRSSPSRAHRRADRRRARGHATAGASPRRSARRDERLATRRRRSPSPNVVIVHEPTAGRATVWPPRTPTRWALPEDAFEHRAGMITKAEVRALALAALGPGTGDLVWDVGCGSGSVADRVRAPRRRRRSRSTTTPRRSRSRPATPPRTACPLAHRRSAPRPRRCATCRDPDAVFVGGGGAALAILDAATRAAPRGGRHARPGRAHRADDRAPRAHGLEVTATTLQASRAEAARRRPPPRRGEPGDRDRGAAPMSRTSVVAGVGCSLGCPPDELLALIEATLAGRRAASRSRPSTAARTSRACSPRPSTSACRCAPTPPRRSPRSTCRRRQRRRRAPRRHAERRRGRGAARPARRLLVPKRRSEHATCAVAEWPQSDPSDRGRELPDPARRGSTSATCRRSRARSPSA